jgi:hypothetical protein
MGRDVARTLRLFLVVRFAKIIHFLIQPVFSVTTVVESHGLTITSRGDVTALKLLLTCFTNELLS